MIIVPEMIHLSTFFLIYFLHTACPIESCNTTRIYQLVLPNFRTYKTKSCFDVVAINMLIKLPPDTHS